MQTYNVQIILFASYLRIRSTLDLTELHTDTYIVSVIKVRYHYKALFFIL